MVKEKTRYLVQFTQRYQDEYVFCDKIEIKNGSIIFYNYDDNDELKIDRVYPTNITLLSTPPIEEIVNEPIDPFNNLNDDLEF